MATMTARLNDENISSENLSKLDTVKVCDTSEKKEEQEINEVLNIVFYTGISTDIRPDDAVLKIRLPKKLKVRLKEVSKKLDSTKFTNSAALLMKEVLADKQRTTRILAIMNKRKEHHDKVYKRMMKKVKSQRYDMTYFSVLPPKLFKRIEGVKKNRKDATLLREEFSANYFRCRAQLLDLAVKHRNFASQMCCKISREYKMNFALEPNCTQESLKLPEKLEKRQKYLREKYKLQKHSSRHSQAEKRRESYLQMRKHSPRLKRK